MQNKLVPSTNYNNSSYLIKRLFIDHMKPYMGKFTLAVLCMIVVAATTAASAYLMQHIIDDVFIAKDIFFLKIIAFSLLGIFLFKGVCLFGQNYIMQCLGQRIIADMQMFLYRHLLYTDLAQITLESSGRIISRFTNDINTLRTSISVIMTGLAKESLTLTFLVAVMFYQSVTLSLITFLAFPIAIYPIMRLGKRMRKISNSTQEEMGEFTTRLDETFSGIRVIKAYRQEEFEIKRATSTVEKIYKLYTKAARNQSAASPIMETIGGISIAAVVWYGGMQVINEATTAGKFFSFITAALMAYKPAKSLSSMNTTLQDGLAAARRLFILLDTESQIKNSPNAIDLKLDNKNADIIFDKVKFSYAEEKQALKDISIKAPAGKTIALVGSSGGGKSTIMNLILRFYEANSGSIKIADHNIKDIKIGSLRENISFVSQDINLFDDTVAANIAYAKPDASIAQIEQAAKAAYADEFIAKLSDGYNTIIGQHGAKLSGGQRQRIAIARAILKNAPILLLDEATSSLDSISEKKIQNALEKLMKDRTTIVIAHRLSTIENADIIYVIKNGKVAESGKHSTLLKKKGEYTKLHKGLENE